MAETTADVPEAPPKRSKLPLILGVVLALAGGGGGFFAVQSGMLGGGDSHDAAATPEPEGEDVAPLADIAFVEVPPIVVSLGPGAQADFVRFRASLEVPRQYEAEMTTLLPRVQDVLNSYLRALDPQDIEAQGALFKLRAQMLRRVKMVAGEGRVRDLLVLEFVLN